MFRKKADELSTHFPVNVIEEGNYRPELGSRTLFSTLVPVYDEDGNPLFLMVVSEDITERKRAEETLKRQLAEKAVLQEISTLGIQTTSLDELLEKTITIVGERLYPDNLDLLWMKGKGFTLSHNFSRINSADLISHPAGKRITGKTALDGVPRRINEIENEADYISFDTQMRSEMCIPIKTNDRIFGVINSESTEPGAFSADDERLLSTLADQLAVAVVRLELEGELKQRLTELEKAKETAEAATHAKSEFLANMSQRFAPQ